jgi:hypothetical protein
MFKPSFGHPGMLARHWRNFPLRQICPWRPNFASDVEPIDCVAHNAGRSLKQISRRGRSPRAGITRTIDKTGQALVLAR